MLQHWKFLKMIKIFIGDWKIKIKIMKNKRKIELNILKSISYISWKIKYYPIFYEILGGKIIKCLNENEQEEDNAVCFYWIFILLDIYHQLTNIYIIIQFNIMQFLLHNTIF